MWLILFIMVVVLLIALSILVLVGRAIERRRLQAMMHGVRYDTLEELGISVLAVDGVDRRQLVELLEVEYPYYEVVVALAGDAAEERRRELIEHYHLIRVDYHPTGDLRVEGVRGLYRSRKRRFRRLVLLDLSEGLSLPLRLNAAADVAAYEYLLPLRRGVRLRAGVVELLVGELGTLREESFEPIRSAEGCRTALYVRSSVIGAGGFGHKGGRLLGRRLSMPIFESRSSRGGLRRLVGWGVVLLVGWLVVGFWAGWAWWFVVSLFLTGGVVLLVAVRLRQMARY